MVASMTGGSDGRPYLAASWARSSGSIPGATRIRPRRSASSPAAALNRGSPASARLTLATEPGVRMLPARQSRLGPTATGSASRVSVRFGSIPATTTAPSISSPPASDDAGRAAVARGDRDDLGVGADLDAGRARRGLEGRAERARAAPREDRLAGRAAVVAGRIGQQDGGRAGRPRPDRGVLDAAPGDRRLERVGLERTRPRSRRRPSAGPAVIVRPSRWPRPRNVRPSCSPASASPRPGRLDVGRRPRRELAEEPAERPDEPVERRVGVGVVRATGRAGPRPSAPTSRPERRPPGRPGRGAKTRTSGATSDRPWRLRSRSRTTDGRSRPTVWASVGTRAPGASSVVLGRAADRVAPLEDERPQAGLARGRRP